MRNVWKIIKDDFKLLFSNVISIVVVIGLVVVPGMYVWFNLAGVWDPYNNVDNLEVAIVNEDEGYKSEVLPIDLKIGNELVTSLNSNKGFKWAFTDFDDAMSKLHDGDYYAVIVIPRDFSTQLLSIIGGEVESANLEYYSNEKSNPIAPKITGKGASTIQQKINNEFSATIYSIILKTASNLLNSSTVDDASNLGKSLIGVLSGARDSMENVVSEISLIKVEVETLKSTVEQIQKDIPSSDSKLFNTLRGYLDEAKQSAQSASEVLEYVKDVLPAEDYNKFKELVDGMKSSIDNCYKIVDDAAMTSDDLSVTLSSLNNVLLEFDDQLSSMQDTFKLIAGDFESARNRLSLITSSTTVEDLRKIIGEDTNKFATLITTPVLMERNVVFPMANNAASMSGFYIAICIWVGALLLAALLKAELSTEREKELKKQGLKNWQVYLGRYAVFAVISLCQVTFISLGCLFFLQIPCAHPLLYVLTMWIVSVCFSLFIYTMLASFGSIGKALCVILLVLQICATGGTFPIQLVLEPFQLISPFLPGTYALKAINMCVAGFAGMDLFICLAYLVLTLIPLCLLLGMLLRNPIIKLNENFKEKVREANLLAI